MKTEQRIFVPDQGWSQPGALADAQLVLAFGGTEVLATDGWYATLENDYPAALWMGCSTSGEIAGTRVHDDSVVVTAVHFERTELKLAQLELTDELSSYEAGERLVQELPTQGLVHVFVLSDGLHMNGSELVRGMRSRLPAQVQVTGGLAGDGGRFERTLVFFNGAPQTRAVAALGLYGDALRVGYGSLGGWDPFGPLRVVTRSDGNVLFELDGQPALALYKKYLGEHADGLPATGLLFPLSMRVPGRDKPVVRTILSVDEAAQSLTFAGDMPAGSVAQLMKANLERLIDGASGAAAACNESVDNSGPDLAILISCVGRKLVLKQRTEEEVEAVRDVLGERASLAGFYSYGEIAPVEGNSSCELHNQTMTITTFREVNGSLGSVSATPHS